MTGEQDKQVTLRFESTLDSSESNPLLLSGPIELFASVDEFGELLSNELFESIKERLIEVADKEHPNIVVFVNNITGMNPDSQEHRGAYFLFVGDKTDKQLTITSWQEILLGTHSHSNIKALEQLEELSLTSNDSDKLLALDKDNNFKLVDFSSTSGSCLPELPTEIKNYKKEIEEYKKLHEPTDEEWHHLDAKLDELVDTYDWLRRQPDGSYKNLAVGNCRELYHELLRSNKKLYLNSDYTYTKEKTDFGSLLLEAFLVNYNTSKTEKDYENAIEDKTNPNHLILKLDFPFLIDEKDEIFLFDGKDKESGKYISDENCTIFRENKSLSLVLNKSYFNFDEARKLTVLFIHNFKGNRQDLINSGINLYEINNELIKLYIEGEFNRKPNLPKYYLSTDAEGEICWDNKLLPSQTFYHESIIITKDDLKEDSNYIDVEFNTTYKIDEDYPILIINDYFAFDLVPSLQDDKMVYKIPKNKDIGLHSIEDELENDGNVELNLIVIKTTSPGSIANELAKDYVSKKDAVAILSHGKIKLSDYAKTSELTKFALLNHTHSQYALKTHNHDYRYANYHHTHPELALLIKEIQTGASEEDIQKWLEEQAKKNKEQFEALIKSLGLHEKEGTYYLDDTNTLLSEESISEINEYLDKNKLDEAKFSEGMSVKDAICLFARLFEKDTVKDSQVLLEDPIRSIYDIGGIKKNTLFETGTDLRTILTQMMNPFISVDDAVKILKPKKAVLKWYKSSTSFNGDLNDRTNFYEINPKHILEYEVEEDPIFYFEIVNVLNEKNEKCEMDINKFGENIKQKTNIFVEDEKEQIFHKYIIEDTEDLENLSDIKFLWEVISGTETNFIYDNYGLNKKDINEENRLLYQKPEFEYGNPAIFIGNIKPELDETGYPVITDEIYKELEASFLDNEIKHIFDLNDEKILILLLVKESIAENEDLVIRNCFTGNRIEDFFGQLYAKTEDKLVQYRGIKYVPMAYDVQTNKIKKLKITIERLTKVGGET